MNDDIQNKFNEFGLKKIKRFSGGMSNYTYLVEDEKSNKYVFRYPGENNDYFVDYTKLNNNLCEIANLNISSENIYFNEINGIKISKYIEGESLVKQKKIDNLKLIQLLKELHNSGINMIEYQHLQRLNKYERLANNNSNEYSYLKNEWLVIYDDILKEYIIFPCHGDLQLSNIIQTKDNNYKLIDFEFSGLNDYIYDIACLGNNDFEFSKKILELYVSKLEKNHIKRLYGWRIFQCLQWYNVASIKYNNGLSEKLNINFSYISEMYLESAKELLDKYKKL